MLFIVKVQWSNQNRCSLQLNNATTFVTNNRLCLLWYVMCGVMVTLTYILELVYKSKLL